MTIRQTRLHASAVAHRGRGLLITGASGSGKSTLAVKMIALGADLIADDQVLVSEHTDRLQLSSPPSIAGLMELRRIGLIRLPFLQEVPLTLLVDLDQSARERLPQPAFRDLLDRPVRLIFGRDHPALAAALMAVLAADGLCDPDTPMPREA